MNYGYKFKALQDKIEALRKEAEGVKKSFDDATAFTDKFLNLCKDHGLSKIAIGVTHDSVDGCKDWPWSGDGSVFSNDHREDGTWPTIWRVVKEANISGGCGNTMQHQADTSRLVDGVYHLKNGKWHKLEDER